MAMQFTAEQVIPADIETVWAALNNIDVLRACIPGCQEINEDVPNLIEAVATVKIGPIKAKFAGKIDILERVAPRKFVMQGEGKGGIAGFAKGGADITLTAVEGGTLLAYVANVDIGGKIAQLGGRLITSVAQKLTAEFFATFETQIVPAADTAAA